MGAPSPPGSASISPDEPWPRAVEFGKQLRGFRGERTLAEFGALADTSTGYLSMLERGLARPSRSLVARLDDVCQAEGRLLEAFPLLLDEWAARGDARRAQARTHTAASVPSAGGELHTRRNRATDQYDGSAAPSGRSGTDGSLRKEAATTKRRPFLATGAALLTTAAAESSKLLRVFEQNNVGARSLDDLEGQAWWLAERYWAIPPTVALQHANALFVEVSSLLGGRQASRQRARLELLAGQLSWYRGAATGFGLGDFLSARRHMLVTRAAGELLDHHLLLASAAELESAIAFYQGNYVVARDAARVGQRYPVPYLAVRLAMNEARACASLGDAEGVRHAVQRAHVHAAEAQGVELGASSPFTPAVFAMYESLAAVRVGDERAEALSREAVHRFELLGGRGDPEDAALARLNLATALAKAARPDPDQAAMIGVEALHGRPDMRKEAIRRRGHELWQALGSWQGRSAVRDFGEMLRAYQPRNELPSPPKTASQRRAE